MKNQQLPGVADETINFFQKVRKFPIPHDQTAAVALLVIRADKEPILGAIKLRKKIGSMGKKHKVKIITTLSIVWDRLKLLGLLERIGNKHQYRLTGMGVMVACSYTAILNTLGPVTELLPEQSEQKPVENIPDDVLIKELRAQIKQKDKEILQLTGEIVSAGIDDELTLRSAG